MARKSPQKKEKCGICGSMYYKGSLSSHSAEHKRLEEKHRKNDRKVKK